jgi:rubrerythrin
MIEDITLKNCLEFAIKTEEIGSQLYERLAKKLSHNTDVSEIFKQLGRDELVHKKQFSKLLAQLPNEVGIVESPEKREYVKAMSISEFFSPTHGPFANIDEIEDHYDALERAFGLEKATLSFYKAVEDILGENEILVQVIEEEKRHIVAIMKVMTTGAKFRSLQDKW